MLGRTEGDYQSRGICSGVTEPAARVYDLDGTPVRLAVD